MPAAAETTATVIANVLTTNPWNAAPPCAYIYLHKWLYSVQTEFCPIPIGASRHLMSRPLAISMRASLHRREGPLIASICPQKPVKGFCEYDSPEWL